MNKQRPLILLLLLVYIFSPAIFDWVTSTSGQWYRPFIIWLLIIVVAYVVQARGKSNDV